MNLQAFIEELEKRHLADLRFSEVTRALRALSSAYVERRESALADHRALDGAGKRAAFGLYYGPLHFLLVRHIVGEIAASISPGTVVDLGCGTGLMGERLRPHCDCLEGYDISSGMLREARAKDIYDELERADLATLRFDCMRILLAW